MLKGFGHLLRSEDIAMFQIIVPTGYMGSGSSAITDLISEIEGYDAPNGTFEYVFLHCPNGVFDLADKLLIGNNALRSDEALHSFYHTMCELHSKKYWWVANYRTRVSPNFLRITEEYIEQLIQFKPNFYWYQQENTNTRMFWQLCVKKAVSLLTFHKVQLPKPLLYPEVWLSIPSQEEFYRLTKEYIRKIMVEIGVEKRNLVLDQLLLPFNLFRVDDYFDDNLHVFSVTRDPRDVFIINKYVWPAKNEVVPFPTDAEQFAQFYRRMRQSEQQSDSSKIHRFAFEDLIYRYDESLQRVYDALQVSSQAHTAKRQCFDPDRSINNTQLFLVKDQYRKEAQIIADLLPEYLYQFPYERVPEIGRTF